MLLFVLVASVVLRLFMIVAPHQFDLPTVLRVAVVGRVWYMAILILVAVFLYSAVRLAWLAVREKAAMSSVLITVAGLPVLVVLLQIMPTFFQEVVSYHSGKPYDDVFRSVQTLCYTWEVTHSSVERYDFNPRDSDLGILADEEQVRVWREHNTVFFNFGDDDVPVGLACALGGDEPTKEGRRSRTYDYVPIDGMFYEFYGKDL